MATKITRPGDIRSPLLGAHQTQDLGCPTSTATKEYPTTFAAITPECQNIPRVLIQNAFDGMVDPDVADVKMMAEIRSLMNDFMENLFSLEIKHI